MKGKPFVLLFRPASGEQCGRRSVLAGGYFWCRNDERPGLGTAAMLSVAPQKKAPRPNVKAGPMPARLYRVLRGRNSD